MELEIYTRFTFRSPVAPSADHIASATSAGLAVLGPTLRRLWSFRHCAKRQRSDQTGRGGLPGLRALVAVAAQRPGRCRWWETSEVQKSCLSTNSSARPAASTLR